jgi:hypothetical protein
VIGWNRPPRVFWLRFEGLPPFVEYLGYFGSPVGFFLPDFFSPMGPNGSRHGIP